MRRVTLALLAVSTAVIGVARLRAPTAARPAPAAAATVTPRALPVPDTPLPSPADGIDRAAVRMVARRWVEQMWTRPPGAAPFAWLGGVADITSPNLLARLATARPTAADEESSTVTIDGTYSDALDPNVVTVTCVAHLLGPGGAHDEPCATTVTVTSGPGGSLIVGAVR